MSSIGQKRERETPSSDPGSSLAKKQCAASTLEPVAAGFQNVALPGAEERRTRVLQLGACPMKKPNYNGPHMWFCTTQVEHMYTVMQGLRRILTSCEIVFSEKGMRITEMDNSKVALVDLRITADTLEEGVYVCNHRYRVAVDMEEFANRLKMGKRDEFMVMELRGPNPDKLRMMFSQGDNMVGTMDLSLNNLDDEHYDVPNLTYTNQVDLLSSDFRDKVTLFKGDTSLSQITFTKWPNRFALAVQTTKGPIQYDFLLEEEDGEDPDAEQEKIQFTFSLKHIINFTTVTKATKYVNINLPDPANPQPLRIRYKIAAMGDVRFYLAPVVPDDYESQTEIVANGDDEV